MVLGPDLPQPTQAAAPIELLEIKVRLLGESDEACLTDEILRYFRSLDIG